MNQLHRDEHVSAASRNLSEDLHSSSQVGTVGTTNVTVAAPVFLYDMWDNRVNTERVKVFASFLIPTERINQPQLHFSHTLKEFNLQYSHILQNSIPFILATMAAVPSPLPLLIPFHQRIGSTLRLDSW